MKTNIPYHSKILDIHNMVRSVDEGKKEKMLDRRLGILEGTKSDVVRDNQLELLYPTFLPFNFKRYFELAKNPINNTTIILDAGTRRVEGDTWGIQHRY